MSRRGDEDFVAFVSASSSTLLRTAWLLCGDAAQAEDLVQEAFERVYLKWGRVSREGRPLAYTRRVVVNLNTDRWRRTRREVVSDNVRESAASDTFDGSDDRDQITRLLQALPRREREVIVLRHYADMSEHDVARTLGISVGTVKSSASRGLATLRSALSTTEAQS